MNQIFNKTFQANENINVEDHVYRTVNPETGEVFEAKPVEVEKVEQIAPGLANKVITLWNKLANDYGGLIQKYNSDIRFPAIYLCDGDELHKMALSVKRDRSEEMEWSRRTMNFEPAHNVIYIATDFFNSRNEQEDPLEIDYAIMEEFVHLITSSAKRNKLAFLESLYKVDVKQFAKPGFYTWEKANYTEEPDLSHVELLNNLNDPTGLNLTENLTRMFTLSVLDPNAQIGITSESMDANSDNIFLHLSALQPAYNAVKKGYKGNFQKRTLEALLIGDEKLVDEILINPLIENTSQFSSNPITTAKPAAFSAVIKLLAKKLREEDLIIFNNNAYEL
jgi:hypothetical protein